MRILGFILGFSAVVSAASPTTETVLRSTGRSLESLWDQLSSVSCTESVEQLKLDAHGKPMYRLDSAFDYLVMLQMTGNDVVVEESRTPVKQGAAPKDKPLLVTNGFATLALIFHPAFQNAFEYGAPEPVVEDGRSLLRVSFQHVRGARSPSALRLRGHDYPVEWQGAAWIDQDTGALVRISARLAAPMQDVGLEAMTADVRYAPQEFKAQPVAFWLPQSAAIEVETPRQRWRNVHTFSNYKLFSVDVKVETENPK